MGILKSRDITFPIKVCVVKAMVYPIVMYGCDSWTIKKAECWRTDAFELWCWRRLLRVSCIARRSNQSILKEINPEYSLEGLMLKLKLQYFGCLMRRADSLEKKPFPTWERLKEAEDNMVRQHHQPNGHKFEPSVGDSKSQGSWTCCSLWGPKDLAVEQQHWIRKHLGI